MISSMGSDIQYSTEMLYPSVSFYSSMREVTRKPTELLQRKGEGWGRTEKGRGRAGRGQVNTKQLESPSCTRQGNGDQRSFKSHVVHSGVTRNLLRIFPGPGLSWGLEAAGSLGMHNMNLPEKPERKKNRQPDQCGSRKRKPGHCVHKDV